MFDLQRCYCIECGALELDPDKYDLHQKRCTFHFMKWARRQGLTKHWSVDDEVIDNFHIGGHERGWEDRA